MCCTFFEIERALLRGAAEFIQKARQNRLLLLTKELPLNQDISCGTSVP